LGRSQSGTLFGGVWALYYSQGIKVSYPFARQAKCTQAGGRSTSGKMIIMIIIRIMRMIIMIIIVDK